MLQYILCFFFFFFNDTATTEIYTLSLHDALPIYITPVAGIISEQFSTPLSHVSLRARAWQNPNIDRKSTRLNSSHGYISYAVFCLKKKKTQQIKSNPRHELDPPINPAFTRRHTLY